MKRQLTPAVIDLDAALAGVAAMNVEQLRDLWRQKRGQEPPAAFSKDLIARALAYWLQEEVLGGLDPRIRKLLVAREKGLSARHVKVGSIMKFWSSRAASAGRDRSLRACRPSPARSPEP
jgi:Protein of unknown function (DUF2924)